MKVSVNKLNHLLIILMSILWKHERLPGLCIHLTNYYLLYRMKELLNVVRRNGLGEQVKRSIRDTKACNGP